MKSLRSLFFVLALLCCFPLHAHSQAAAYGAVGFSDYGYTDKYSGQTYIYADTVALNAGGFYLVPSSNNNKFGIDFRFQGSPGSRGGKVGSVAFRYAYIPTERRLRPYAQVGFGVVSTTASEPTNLTLGGGYAYQRSTLNSPAIGINGGLDLRLTSSWDYRIIDLQEYVGLGKNPIAASAAFTTGVVYHFSSFRSSR